jgi:hypothetical protein
MINFVGTTSAYDAYTAALATNCMGNDLANKYANYVEKKLRQKQKNRVCLTTDSSMNKVYRAEWALQRKYSELKESMTEKQVKAYFKRVKGSKTYQKLCEDNGNGKKNPDLRIMRDMGGRSRIAGTASSWGGMSLSPSTGFNKYTILHEFAHLCGNMHHDVGFRQDLLKLVSRFLGVKYAKDLKKEFKERKLKLSVSQTIQSPLKWLETYEKMAAMRAKMEA